MSIEMKNPKTPLEKADAASNLIEQMFLAHTIRDEKKFADVHMRAGKIMFDLCRQLEEMED